MTAAAPQLPKIVTFTLKASGDGGAVKSFAEDCIDIAVVPTPGAILSVLTLDGVTHQDIAAESWAFQIKAVQDWDSGRPGLAQYLWAYKGQTAAFVYSASGGTESAALPKMTGSCILTPIPYGGAGNAYAEADVTLPITGTLTLDATP